MQSYRSATFDLKHLQRALPRRVYNRFLQLWALSWLEAIYLAVWPLVYLAFSFLAFTIWGGFEGLPVIVHVGLLSGFALLSVWLVLRAKKQFRAPDPEQVLTRLEQASRLKNAPLHALADKAQSAENDQAIYKLYQQRVLARLGHLKIGWPKISLAPQDPYGLRVLPVLLLAAGAVLFAPMWTKRLAQPFSLNFAAPVPAQISAWVDAPEYTGKGLIPLQNGKLVPPLPAGSQLNVQLNGARAAQMQIGQAEFQVSKKASKKMLSHSFVHSLEAGNSRVRVQAGGQDLLNLPFAVVPDESPVIKLLQEPQFAPSGALRLEYNLWDDYGIESAAAVFSTSDRMEPHVLVPPPRVDLLLPAGSIGNGRTFRDLSASPWAGELLALDVVAVDHLGQADAVREKLVTIPERQFSNPYAAKIIALRKQLAFDKRERRAVVYGLGVLLNELAQDQADAGVYLSVARAAWRLRLARDESEQVSALDLLWRVALELEGANAALAAENLRTAQEALREALRNNAPPEEIAQRLEELKQVIAEYLSNMPQMAMTPEQMQMLENQQGQSLQDMFDAMQSMSEMGARDQAEALLNQLESMLENLQNNANPNEGQTSPTMQSLQELEKLMREQQALRDQTYRQQQLEQGEAEQKTEQQLANEQQQLAERLEELLQKLQEQQQSQQGREPQQGQDPAQGEAGSQNQGQSEGQGQAQGEGGDQASQQALAEALANMRGSEGALRQKGLERSTKAQNRALDAMREAGRGMLEQLAREQQSQQGQQGRGSQMRMPGQGFSQSGRDPLGRNQGGENDRDGNLPNEVERERVREILRSLREQLSTPDLPEADSDYLERLLDY